MSEWPCTFRGCSGVGEVDGTQCACCRGLGYHGGGVDCLSDDDEDDTQVIPEESMAQMVATPSNGIPLAIARERTKPYPFSPPGRLILRVS